MTTKEFLVFAALSDEELLRHVYMKHDASTLEVELARRLEQTLDDLSTQPVPLELLVAQHGGPDGTDP